MPTARDTDKQPPGQPGPTRVGERSRLRPPPPAQAHAPLLLGLDAAGAEHTVGPDDTDDEALVGRCWGCVCGWRGQRRDIATRHFRPQVGDGGGLRRTRLARSDRDARPELEAHLTGTASPTGSAAPAEAAADDALSTPPMVVPPADTPKEVLGVTPVRRRRLTLPPAAPNDGHSPSSAVPREPTRVAVPPNPPRPLPAPQYRELDALTSRNAAPEAHPETSGAEIGEQDRARGAPAPGTPPSLRTELRAPAAGPAEDAVAGAASRARAARAELAAAENALDAAVAAARQRGASWRTIARLSGTPHREAAARWGDSRAGPLL